MVGQLMNVNTKVLITAIISGSLVLISLVLGLVFLAHTHGDASTVLSLVASIVSIINLAQVNALKSVINQLREQTNGNTTKLIDAAIQAAPPANKE